MTGQDRHLLYTLLGSAATLLLGGSLLVWPSVRATRSAEAEIETLRRKIALRAEQTQRVERAARELDLLERRVEADFRVIPESADIAQIMRILSLPVDERTVFDQTFTAGAAVEAVTGSSFPERAVPLSVDMKATFDSVYLVLATAERTERLVRVSSVRLAADRTAGDPAQMPMLIASVGLEVIYEPPPTVETAR